MHMHTYVCMYIYIYIYIPAAREIPKYIIRQYGAEYTTMVLSRDTEFNILGIFQGKKNILVYFFGKHMFPSRVNQFEM